MKIELELTKRTDSRLLYLMSIHYSQPEGFVGRNRPFAIYYGGVYYGHIVGGSASLHLTGRDGYLGVTKNDLRGVINNIFFSVHKINDSYPIRNFTSKVVSLWRERALQDWEQYYGDKVIGFETLVELPRTGELYRRDGWEFVGQTKGQTCKRIAGKGTDSWSGKRVWDVINLRPKLVFCIKA
jgi:hypothetical protein